MFVIAGDVQCLDQYAPMLVEQPVALGNPAGQPPVFGGGDAELQQRDAQQRLLDLAGGLAFDQYALLPGLQQFRVRGDQRPRRRKKQQAAPVDFLPESRQA